MSFLPLGLEPYAWIIYTGIYFAIGLLIGLAAKKMVIAVIMVAIAAVIAVFLLGLSVAVDMGSLAQRAWSLIVNAYSNYGIPLLTYPVAFGIGVFLGFWKGR